MADPLSSLIRPNPGPQLPAFARFAPAPPENVVLAELNARTAPGDVVIDLHGRGAWVARNAIGALRRVYACESTALTRLLADVVMRPPDLRHFDAALSTLATHPRGDVGLRRALEQPFTSRCPTCGRPVVVEEYIWESNGADSAVPTRKVFRCSFCRDQGGKTVDLRIEPVDEKDVATAHEKVDAERARPACAPAFQSRPRSPSPAMGAPARPRRSDLPNANLPDEILDLYTARTLVALDAIVSRLDNDLRAQPLDAALRLGLAHALIPLSRLNGYPGRTAALRIRSGHVQQPTSVAWRERNPWLAFEEGCREVRSFIVRVEQGAASFQPRPGEDMEVADRRVGERRRSRRPGVRAGQRAAFLVATDHPARPARSAIASQPRPDPAAAALERRERLVRVPRHVHGARPAPGLCSAA